MMDEVVARVLYTELTQKLSDSKIWEDPKAAQDLNRERVHLEKEVTIFLDLEK